MSIGERVSTPATTSASVRVGQLGVLTVVLVLLFVIPSRLNFAPLGAAGSPTQMVGMSLFAIWAVRRLIVRSVATPLHWVMVAFAGAVLASYLMAAIRPITAPEASGADRGILAMIGWLGLFLTVAEGLPTRAALETFLRRVVFGGAFVATVGLLQFATKQELTNYISIPGLSDNSGTVLGARNGLIRPQGTTLHPIEFGAVLTIVLPLALHFAMTDTGRNVWRRWYPVAAIAFAIPISISRSAIISAAVILITLIPTWTRPVRHRAYATILVLAGVLYVSVPGLLGTITGLFSGISSDDSTQSRTGSYQLAMQFIDRSPWFGRGFQTFLVDYRILDNEYLTLLIHVGIVGTAVVLGLFATSMLMCRAIRRRVEDPATRSLAQALVASVASMTFSMAVFDAFSFPMATNLLFLVLGSSAALWLVTRPQRDAKVGG